MALHVQAGTHPKLIQERMGYSSIALTMDVYGNIAGRMQLAQAQEERLEALTARAGTEGAGDEFPGERRIRSRTRQNFRFPNLPL